MGLGKSAKKAIGKRAETASTYKEEITEFGHRFRDATRSTRNGYKEGVRSNWQEEKSRLPLLFFTTMSIVGAVLVVTQVVMIIVRASSGTDFGSNVTSLVMYSVFTAIAFGVKLALGVFYGQSSGRSPSKRKAKSSDNFKLS